MRRKDREITNAEEITRIVEKAKILHLGLFDGDYPYVVPLHYGFTYKDDAFFFYMHSAKEMHKLELIKENPHVCVELECDIVPVSGGQIPCQYGSTYASVIGKGKAELVSDVPEKIHGLELLMENQTGQKFAFDEKMAASVAIIKVVVSDFTAKSRK